MISTQAVISGRADLCEALLDQGAPIDCGYVREAPHFTMLKGHTPLAVAGEYARDSTIIDLLLRRGADPRQHIDEYGLTALHFTCVCGNVNGIRALCAHDETLLEVRNGHGEITKLLLGHAATLNFSEVDASSELCERARSLISEESNVHSVRAPVTVVGDIHGQFHDLLEMFKLGGYAPDTNYLFLGDYVDRGKQSIESLCILLAFKLKHPDNVHLLRGNHECQNITKIYGFWDECKRRYKPKLWRAFINLFNHLPVAALIDDRVLCMHGGLS